jgi:hypothetical protein
VNNSARAGDSCNGKSNGNGFYRRTALPLNRTTAERLNG